MSRWTVGVGLALVLVIVVASVGLPRTTRGDENATETVDHPVQTQVSVLQTQVSVLQTQVSRLLPTVRPTSTAPVVPTATVVSRCGRPYRAWGTATADAIGVQLVAVHLPVAGVTPMPGQQPVGIEIAVTNGGTEPLIIRGDDFILTDCDGTDYAAGDDTSAPVLTDGELVPGETVQGVLVFTLPAGAQPAAFTYHIRQTDRTGTRVHCPLVNRRAATAEFVANPTGSAGCSAVGGSATRRGSLRG